MTNIPPHVHMLAFLTKQPDPILSRFCPESVFYSALVAFLTGEKKVAVAKQFEEIKENGTLL